MPPKKKKTGKKKKKSGVKSAKKSKSDKQIQGLKPEGLNEVGKEYYMIQIRDLETRVARYQRKCDELELANGKFKDQYEQLIADKQDIVSFLKKSLEQRADEIADLNDRLIGLQQAKDAEKEMYDSQLQQLRTEFQETKDQLTSENMILSGKLASLEEFKVQKEDLMAKFAKMEEELKTQEENHKELIYNLERKAVVDKDRLKKEMVMRVNQVAAEFRKVSNKQMAETTKRTIRENVSINGQLSKMSDKTIELITENDEVKRKGKKQRQQIELLETNEKELAKKNHSNQKVLRMLTEKCKEQESMLEEYEMRDNEYQQTEKEAELLQQQNKSLREELISLAKETELLQEQMGYYEQELKAHKRAKTKLENVLYDCSKALKYALTSTPDDPAYEAAGKRDHLLETLLNILNSSAALGVGPTIGEFHRPVTDPHSFGPGRSKGLHKTDSPLSPIHKHSDSTHYQLGDLGLIPRPDQHIPSSQDKTKDMPATGQLGALKRVPNKSVAVQTVSAPRALFYADQLMSRVPASAKAAIIHELHKEPLRRKNMPTIY